MNDEPDVIPTREGHVAGRHVELRAGRSPAFLQCPMETSSGVLDDRQLSAMIFSSTEIGTGSATTPTVVRVGWIASKYSP